MYVATAQKVAHLAISLLLDNIFLNLSYLCIWLYNLIKVAD